MPKSVKPAKKNGDPDFVKATTSKYSAESITVLEGLEPVRKRPGMYIGTTGPDGLHHLVTENGRGIPVDTHKQTKVSALETIMTTLHAGGKFGGEGYKISGGLHGVGGSVVNALSAYCKAVIHRDGGIYVQEYSQGKKKFAVKKIDNSKLHGTIVTFEPDQEIFSTKGGSTSGGKDNKIAFDWQTIVNHIRQQAYLVKGLKILIIDAREWE